MNRSVIELGDAKVILQFDDGRELTGRVENVNVLVETDEFTVTDADWNEVAHYKHSNAFLSGTFVEDDDGFFYKIEVNDA